MPGFTLGIRLGSYRAKNLVGGSSLHADTVSFRDRVIANGGAISTEDLSAIDTNLVRPAYTNGLRDEAGTNHRIIDCSPLAGNNLAAAQVKLWYPTGVSDKLTLFNFVAGDYSRTTGLNPGNSNTTKYALLGIKESNFSNLDAHLAFYSTSSTYGTAAGRDIGQVQDRFQLIIKYSSSLGSYYRCFAANTAIENITPPASSIGLFIGTKLNNTTSISRNGVNYGTNVAAPTAVEAPSENELELFRGVGNYGKHACGLYSAGKNLNATDRTNFASMAQNLMTAFGRAV